MQVDIWFGLEKFFHIWTSEHFLSTCVWAWKPPLNFPLGCGPGNLQGMLGYHPPQRPTARHAGIPPPPVDRQTPVKI